MAKASLRIRLAQALLGRKVKEFIPPLSPFDNWNTDGNGRINNYLDKKSQVLANIGWVYTANTAIVDACAAVPLKLYRKKSDGDREEITDGPELEILDLLNEPNNAFTGEQMRQLHHTYMNLTGEGYIYMTDLRGGPFIPEPGKLPAALQLMPSHLVQFKLGESYSQSTIKYLNKEYPLMAFIRDINPDPNNPYFGRSVISAAAATLDTEYQMKNWNERFFANNARPSLIFQTDQPLDDVSYERWKQQFNDQHTGSDNAYKPLLIEGGKATPWMLSQTDLDFLESRKFSRDEILAMFRVSPGVIGSVENVNRANLDAGFYINAVINTVPRVRQFVRQVQATLVKVYDPSLELDYENPVPEDKEAKLNEALAGVDKWWTKDEVRDLYGGDPLPDNLGTQIIVTGLAAPLDAVVAGQLLKPDPNADNPEDPNNDGDDDLTNENGDASKSLTGVKKNS